MPLQPHRIPILSAPLLTCLVIPACGDDDNGDGSFGTVSVSGGASMTAPPPMSGTSDATTGDGPLTGGPSSQSDPSDPSATNSDPSDPTNQTNPTMMTTLTTMDPSDPSASGTYGSTYGSGTYGSTYGSGTYGSTYGSGTYGSSSYYGSSAYGSESGYYGCYMQGEYCYYDDECCSGMCNQMSYECQ